LPGRNTPLSYWDKPKDWNMRIPEGFRKCVVFLGRIDADASGQEQTRFIGTGFIVSVPAPLAQDRFYFCLVTAKHVAELLAGSDWVVRSNGKDGSLKDFRVSKDRKWWFHPSEEETTDVAVTGFEGSHLLDHSHVWLTSFLSQGQISDIGIGAGDDVFMVGLFTKARGRAKMLPIVRMGNVAMIPDPGELVPIKMGSQIVEAEVYLIEARSLGGLSGSPVFVQETVGAPLLAPETTQGGTKLKPLVTRLPGALYFLGLMHGHWDIDPDEKNYPDPRRGRKDEAVNMGIAIVVPAKKIKETLYHPELVSGREAKDREYLDMQASTPDAIVFPPTDA
jgi:hypothetical protein